MRLVIVVVIAGLGCLIFSGCGPSVEERKAMAAFNQMEPLIERGGYVKKLERFEQRPDKVFLIEAEIVNEEGKAIGRLRSERVEGFGTARPRIQWYETPGVSEEWRVPPPGQRRGPGGGQRRGPGQDGPRGEGQRRRNQQGEQAGQQPDAPPAE